MTTDYETSAEPTGEVIPPIDYKAENERLRKALLHALPLLDDENTDAEDYEMFKQALGEHWPYK